jgi:hypothetical protein
LTRALLREPRSPEDEAAYYARVYPQGYKHDRWPDHVERVSASVEMIRRYKNKIRTAADLSCGDGAILRALLPDLDLAIVGDLNGVRTDWVDGLPSEAGEVDFVPPAPLPDALWALPEGALPVDLFVLSETLEHMADPDELLRQLTLFSQRLFLSTPVDESPDSGNLEHYWSWGQADIHDMLQSAGWTPLEMQHLKPVSTATLPGAYTYQLWMAVNRT